MDGISIKQNPPQPLGWITDSQVLIDHLKSAKDEYTEHIRIQKDLLGGFNAIMNLLGGATYNIFDDADRAAWTLEYNNVDRTYTWRETNSGLVVGFAEPFYHNSVVVNDDPVELERKPVAANTYTLDNRSGQTVTHVINRTEVVSSTITNVTSKGHNFTLGSNITATIGWNNGLEAGPLATLSAGFNISSSTTTNSSDSVGKTNQTTSAVTNTFSLPPYSRTVIDVSFDQISLRRNYQAYGIADWQQISITTQRADPNSSLNLLRAGGAISITETKGIQALLIKLVGLVPTEDATFFDPQKLPSDRLDVVARNANGNTNVEALNWVARLYDPYYRLTSFGGYIDYNNATNTMIDVYKGGTWEYNPATKSWDLNSDRIA